jgi:hypothetical protein
MISSILGRGSENNQHALMILSTGINSFSNLQSRTRILQVWIYVKGRARPQRGVQAAGAERSQ